MIDTIFYFITVPMVYISFVICIIGILYAVIRILLAPKQASTLQVFPESKASGAMALYDTFAMPTILRDSPFFWVFLMLYHIAFGLLILNHLDLIPGLNIMHPESPHMFGYGAVGLTLTLSVIYFILRRLRSPVREISVMGDYLLLLLLLFVFITGDVISWSNSWGENGFVLGKSDFKNYVDILVSFSFADPAEVLQSSHYVVVVVHIFFANLFILLFPFTKLMHTFFAIPLNKIRRG